jgi:hypothetical protein
MRRKRLARLVRKLRAMRKSLPKRDQLLLRIGAARKEAGRAFRVREDSVAHQGSGGHTRDLLFSGRQGQAESLRTARRPLSTAQ